MRCRRNLLRPLAAAATGVPTLAESKQPRAVRGATALVQSCLPLAASFYYCRLAFTYLLLLCTSLDREPISVSTTPQSLTLSCMRAQNLCRTGSILGFCKAHINGNIMARKKAHKQPSAPLPAFLTLDQLLVRARTGLTHRVKAYLDAGGSPTRQVEVKALGGDRAMVPLLHSLCLSSHDAHRHLAGSIELLTSAGAQIESTCIDMYGDSRTALMWACAVSSSSGCTHPVEALLAAGADVNAVSVTDGATAVGIAASRGSFKAVRVLLRHGADPSIRDITDLDAVGWAAATWRIQVLEVFLEHDPAVFNGCAPLVAAAVSGQLDCARWLLSKGAQRANINAFDYRGWTALHHAAASAQHGERMLQLLLDNGADAGAHQEGEGDALSVLACHRAKVHCAELLLAAGADVTHTNSQGFGALHLAVDHGKTELVEFLLQRGAAALVNSLFPMDCEVCSRVTCIMDSKHAAITQMLLAAGADVHIRSSTGNTCLHVAAHHEHPVPVVCLLIKAGADIAAVNDAGHTAADVAREKRNELLAKLLDRAAAQQA
jgi:ankyrin repeat protein